MKRVPAISLLAMLLALAGCEPQPPPPIVPVKSAAEIRREEYFGPAIAADPSIAWRSSNLGIKIIAAEAGPLIQLQDRVRVHYTGRLKDGTVFADTREQGKPSLFPVNGLIPGWSAAMLTLRAGGQALICVPPHLGYGGIRSGKIPPFSGLIFEIEVLGVNPVPEVKP
jgi:FKBP-type peptidyl-prolyl cis-trans isomerase